MGTSQYKWQGRIHVLLVSLILMAAAPACCSGVPGDLDAAFRTPPHSAGIRAFWWWLNSHVTKEAITQDLEEMKAKGFNGALIFDADGSSQQGNRPAPAGPLFGGPEWTGLFVHACTEARRLNLQLSLNIQSGWNLGGPGVSEAEATQTLVWTETAIKGPVTFNQEIRSAQKSGHFYRDIAVIAVPMANVPSTTQAAVQKKTECQVSASSSQQAFPGVLAMDGDPDTFWVSEQGPDIDTPQWLLLSLSEAMTISELSLLGRTGYGPRDCKIQVSLDNRTFRTVKAVSLKDGQRLKASFEPQQARFIRCLFTSSYDRGVGSGKARNVQVTEIGLPGVAVSGVPAVSSKRPIKDLNLKSSTRELGGSAPDCRYLLDTSPAQPGESTVRCKDILNVTKKMGPDGMLRWDVPAGEWIVIRFGHTATGAHVSTQSAGWGGRVLDYLNPDSLDAYWQRNIDPLFKAIGPMAGTTLRYVHTDSWEGGGMNWTPGFDRAFRDNRGYDPLPWLAVLAGYVVDSREDSNAFLADFRKTIGDRVAEHYGQLAALAKTYGMGTHPECSGPHAGPLDGLKNYGRSELMMSEFWSPSPHRPNPPNRFFVKQAASAAHTYGKRLVGAEAFTTIGPHWNDVPWSAMKPSFDHEFCAGLNLVFNHTFTCSPKEMGLPGQEYFAGTHFNPQVTWWEESPAFIDYFRRCQVLAQQGTFVADVLYYYGDHIPNIATLKESDPAGALPDFDYDVLSEELLLTSLTVKKGHLSLPSGMAYRVLVLPDHRVLSLGALKKVDKLVRAGATVLAPKPLRAVSLEGGAQGRASFQRLADGLWGVKEQAWDQPGSRRVEQGRIAWGMAARDFLHGDGVASDVTFQDRKMASNLDWIHYRIGEAEVYFLSEPNGKARNVTAVFRGQGRIPELWDAVDGSIRDAATFDFADGCTHVPLTFDAYGSLFVVFRMKTERDHNNGPNFATWQQRQVIFGPWDVTFDAQWGGPKDPVRFAALTDWIKHRDPRIKYYSGKARYRTTFKIGDDLAGKSLAIELGQVKDVGIARVTLNGTDLGVVWRPPFRVDVSRAIKPGKNALEVMVVNSWRNRVIGDEALPQDKRLTQTNIKVIKTGSKTWTLEPSGLLGPVLLTEKTMGTSFAQEGDITADTVKQWSAPYRHWHYNPDHVISPTPNIKGIDDIRMTDVPTVFQLPGDKTWYMSFIGFDGKGYQSFIAESDDLVYWDTMRLAMGYGPKDTFDHGGVVLGAYLYEDYDIKAPRTLKKKDGHYFSLYGAYPRQGGYELRPGYEGVASSQDGLIWQRAKDTPILSVHQKDCGTWEKDCIYQPWLVAHKGTYYNFYNAANGGIEQMGLAVSDDLLEWTRYERNPVIPTGPKGSYNEKFSSDGKVFWDTDHWVNFFFGVGRDGAHVLAAFSRDLIHWTVDPEPLYKAGANPSGLDKTYAHKISLVWNPGNQTYYMFYCAVGNRGRGIGLITSKPLLGRQ